jgi:hypothetical protein
MSAPDTNTTRQARRHRPSLLAILASVATALVLLFVFLTWLFAASDAPEETATLGAPLAAFAGIVRLS